MKKIELDIHTHTIVSGHAYGTIREMAKEACDKGLKGIGFAEHAPGIPGTCDPFYYLNYEVVPRKLYDVEVFKGCEVNVLNDGSLSLEEQYMDHLDYAIVGIHMQCYENAGVQRNTDNLISCMKHKKVFFVSHPDDDHTPLDYQRLVQAARDYHVALEVNNSSLIKKDKRLNCIENIKTYVSLCEKMNVPILVSSDAHDPSAVGEMSLAMELLKSIGVSDALILNNDMNKFKKFIGYKGE